jgi:hypothetical protein
MWTEMADKAEGRVTSNDDVSDRETLDDALATIRNA